MKIDKNKPIYKSSPGDGVLEDSALLSFLGISDNPDADISKLVLEMSKVVESFVFYERIFVFDYQIDDENSEGFFMTKNPLILASIIEKLAAEHILNFVQLLPFKYAPQPSVLLKQVKELNIIPEENISRFNKFDFAYYLYQQEVSRRIKTPFISSGNQYVNLFIKNSQNFKYNLAKMLIEKMNIKAENEMKDLINSNRNIEIFIPPFLSIVLNNVIKGASFGDAILDLRNQFKDLRKLFSEYNILFQDPNLSLKEQIKKSSKIISDIEKVSYSFSICDKSRFSVWSDAFDFIIDSTTDIKNYNIINSANLISKIAKYSKNIIKLLILKRRYSSIYRLKEDFYSIKDYSNLLHKAIIPFEEKSKILFPDGGRICVVPGNPFKALDD